MKTIVTKRDLSELSSDIPKVKYRQAKRLVAVAKKNPERVYPHRAIFVKLLKSENNILKWIAIDILGYLSSADKKTSVDGLLDRLVGFLQGGKLVTASHAIGALSNIALARPEYQNRITRELLNVENYKYETKECGNIVLGKAVQAMGSYSTHPRLDADVLRFVRRQTTNPRPATRKKAQKFLIDVSKLREKGA